MNIAVGALIPASAAVALPPAAEADPVYAAIERHRAAYADYDRALRDADVAMLADDPAADTIGDAECSAEAAAIWELVETVPTTLSGLLAMADYAQEFELFSGDIAETFVETTRTALRNLDVSSAPTPSKSPRTRSDAELVELGRQFEVQYLEAVAAENVDEEFISTFVTPKMGDDGYHADSFKEWKCLYSQCGGDRFEKVRADTGFKAEALYNRIMDMPATTIQGFAVKARIATQYILSNLWDKPIGNLDMDKQFFRGLIESICAAAGVPLDPHRFERQRITSTSYVG